MPLPLKLSAALLLATVAFFAIRFAPRDRVADVRAEPLPPPSAPPPKPRPCGADGANPSDYRLFAVPDGGADPNAKVLP